MEAKMASYGSDPAHRELYGLDVILQNWQINQDIDDKEYLESEYWSAAHIMEQLVPAVQPERVVRLKIGETALEGTVLNWNNGYKSSYSMNGRSLPAGSELELKKTARVYSAWGVELYAGFFVKLPLSKIAATLVDGGELSITDRKA